MLLFHRKVVFIALPILFLFNYANAQLSIEDKKGLEKIKDGNTYIISTIVHSPKEDSILQVFKKYWTLTKSVQYIKPGDVRKTIQPGDSFFEIQEVVSSSGSGINTNAYNTHTTATDILALWSPEQSNFKKEKLPKNLSTNAIARIEVSGSVAAIIRAYNEGSSAKADTLAFDGGGQLFNWTPGMIKIYIQQLASALQSGKKVQYEDEITNKQQLALLQTETLYCSNDNFNSIKMFAHAKDGKADDGAAFFEDYKFNYKVLSAKDLDNKILNDTKPVYCLLFIRSSRGKMVAVINSQTGEVIYSRHSIMSWNLKPGDLNDLYKKIR